MQSFNASEKLDLNSVWENAILWYKKYFLGRTITTKGVDPQKQKITKFLQKVKIQQPQRALQRHIGFLNKNLNYIRMLAERLSPFLEILKTTAAEGKSPITPDEMKEFREKNEALDRNSQLALRQPLLGENNGCFED